MRNFTKAALGLATAALLTGSLAACSSTASTSSDSSSKPSAAAPTTPKPVAQLDSLSGKDTQVTLDAGFAAACAKVGYDYGDTLEKIMDAALK